MSTTRRRIALVAATLAVAALAPGATGAAGRIPASSVDDASAPAAARIAAVTDIVRAMNARLVRVEVAYPPNPCAGITEPTATCDAAVAVASAYSTLGGSVHEACAGSSGAVQEDAATLDADAWAAADTSATGITHQLDSIATVLANADARLGAIRTASGGRPGGLEAAALNELSVAVFEGGSVAVGLVGGGAFDWPPNPCLPG